MVYRPGDEPRYRNADRGLPKRKDRRERVTRERVIVLGSGTGIPLRDRRPAGYLVQTGRHAILLDLGPGAWHTAAQFVRPECIDAVLLSHMHVDHALDTVTLLFSLHLYNRNRPRPHTVPIIGSEETLDQVRRWISAVPDLAPTWIRWTPVRPGDRIRVGSHVDITVGCARHVPGSLMYRLEWPNGRSLTYSGDTTWTPALIQLADHTDFLIIECAHAHPNRAHLWPEACAEIAHRAHVRFTLLSHFYPDVLNPGIRARLQTLFRTPFALARDRGVYPLG